MVDVGLGAYVHKLFSNSAIIFTSAVCTCIGDFFFPTSAYLYGAAAVLIAMVVDLLTKLFAKARQNGGLRNAFKTRAINSHDFCKGTTNKLVVFGVMLILCGCANWLVLIDEIALWFTQIVFGIMFLRDVLSIFENLDDAGCDVGLFKKAIKKKLDSVVDSETCTSTSEHEDTTTASANTISSDTPI